MEQMIGNKMGTKFIIDRCWVVQMWKGITQGYGAMEGRQAIWEAA